MGESSDMPDRSKLVAALTPELARQILHAEESV